MKLIIACPICGEKAPERDFWLCDKCGILFNTFEAKTESDIARCPNPSCSESWDWTQCPTCYKKSPHKDWYKYEE
jgi:hypothetical protein